VTRDNFYRWGVGVSTNPLFAHNFYKPLQANIEVHRAALKSSAAKVTTLTNLYSGRPARGIVNRLIEELGPMNGDVPAFPLAASSVSALRSKAERQGSGDFSPLWAGKNASRCSEMPAGVLTKELIEGLKDFYS
jgi:nitronate monooxygenase